MNQANQKQLFQQTNQGLLGIRQSEISYYQSLTVAFGTQAALIGGFTYGVFTENRINRGNGYESVEVLADCYWVCAAVTIAFAVHVILCTMLMQVLGPGLSLNGPVGSMARATEGMRIELKQIIRSFIVMMIMFALSTLLSCWVVMSFEGAVGCSVAFLVAAYHWYKYCERIYLRFYWDDDEFGWNSRGSSIDSFDAHDPAYGDTAAQPGHFDSSLHYSKTKRRPSMKSVYGFFRKGSFAKSTSSRQKSGSGSGSDKRSSDEDQHRNSSDKRSVSGRSNSSSRTANLLSLLTRDRAISEVASEASAAPTVHTTTQSTAHLAPLKKGVMMEGYLTKRGGGTSYLDFRSEPWERRYFTLTNVGNLFVFKNRQEFRNDPKNPIYTRPLHLIDYYIEVHSVTGDPATDKKSVLDTHDDEVANPYRFQMTLVLRDNVHAVQCMTMVGHDGASEVFNALTQSSSTTSLNGTTVRGRSPSTHSNATGVTLSAARQQMYRDHWVLRCDTEEELQQWVNVITALCPSCFVSF